MAPKPFENAPILETWKSPTGGFRAQKRSQAVLVLGRTNEIEQTKETNETTTTTTTRMRSRTRTTVLRAGTAQQQCLTTALMEEPEASREWWFRDWPFPFPSTNSIVNRTSAHAPWYMLHSHLLSAWVYATTNGYLYKNIVVQVHIWKSEKGYLSIGSFPACNPSGDTQ